MLKKFVGKWIIFAAGLLGVLCVLYLALVPTGLLNEWLSKPTEIRALSEQDQRIFGMLGVTLPEDAGFTEGYVTQTRDPSHIYVFVLSLSDKEPQETVDAFVCRKMSLDPNRYGTPKESNFDSLFADDLPALCGRFSRMMTDGENIFSAIHYGVKDDAALWVALDYADG